MVPLIRLLVPFVAVTAIAQERAASLERYVRDHRTARAGADWFPFREGATWRWRVRDAGAEAWTERELVARMEVPAAGGGTWWECRVRTAAGQWFQYWAVRAGGVFLGHNAWSGSMRGVSPLEAPECRLPCPPGIAAVWEWADEERGSFKAQAEEVDDAGRRLRVKATIEAVGEVITVPAGTFEALRVRVVTAHRDWRTRTDTWWVAGIGPMKSRTERAEGTDPRFVEERTEELVAFAPGQVAAAPDADALVTAFLGGPAARTWVAAEPLPSWLRSRFCIVQQAGERVLLRVHRARVARFDPLSVADVESLRADEELDVLPGPNGIGGQGARELARCIAVLAAAAAEVRAKAPAVESGTRKTLCEVRATIAGTAANGEPWSRRLTVRYEDGKVVAIALRPPDG